MRVRLAAGLLVLSLTGARASESEELVEHLGKTVGAFEAARLYGEECKRRDPDGTQRRKDILAAWRYENSGNDYERAMNGLVQRLPDLKRQIDAQSQRLAVLIAEDIAHSPEQCQAFDKLLEDEQFDVEYRVRRMLTLSRNLGIDIPDLAVSTPPTLTEEKPEVVRLAALSALLERKMDEIGSREGARKSAALRRARQDHAEAWLKSIGNQMVFGRVIDAGQLREWKGDRQSSFKVECRSFADDAVEVRMATSIGKDMVVAGTPRWVAVSEESSRIDLDRCFLYSVEEIGLSFSADEAEDGLVPRPLSLEEAYAGPGRGVKAGDVDRVLYAVNFDTRMDGFGNGYVDRGEEIYVLLRDGTAYRHEWSFPFTDFAVDLSRQREPERWFHWTEEDGKVALRATSGTDRADVVDLSDALALRPWASPTLGGDYRYLQIGAGGVRRDRRFDFSADGTVVYSQGGFVAGNFGTSYMIVTGSDAPEATVRYRIEDYALVLVTPQGEERRFLAVPVAADGTPPDTLLIDGTAFWLKKK